MIKVEKNLKILLQNINPVMHKGSYVFLTEKKSIPLDQFKQLKQHALMLFQEIEGETMILKSHLSNIGSEQKWAWIELKVVSDLEAVGFLARITTELAEQGISVNPVSAYYHDHLFVPFAKKEQAMNTLNMLMNK